MKKLIYMLPAAMLVACAPQTYVKKGSAVSGKDFSTVTETTDIKVQAVAERKPLLGMMPKATAFKMSGGDYSNNVAITLGEDGEVAYYPAPSDISKRSVPTSLGDGWYLNNQGIGENSVFTKYTFEEYSKLPAAPSPRELKDAVIPGARVKEMVRLPFSVSEANNNINEIKDYLKSL